MTRRERGAGEPARRELARGVSLFASPSGLIATFGDRPRCTRIDLGDRAREREVLELLRARRFAELLGDERALLEAGVLREASKVPLVVSWIFDPRLEAALAEHPTCVVVCFTTRGLWIVDHGSAGPCARCAVRLSRDPALRASVLPELQASLEPPPLPPDGAIEAIPALVARWQRRVRRRGRALIWRAMDGRTRIERFGRHPSCTCEPPPTRERRPLTWRSAATRELSAVVAVSAPRAPVERVVYRGTRQIVARSAADFGVALASGPRARTRALAEAIERTCMLHALPDVSARAANELDAPRLSDEDIASLLYRAEEYATAGFPFPRYDASVPIDWSFASALGAPDEKVLVPTALVGRVPRGGVRLAHATTNGYAADLDRARAVRSAVLELVERDAVLLGWYLGRSMPRIEAIATTVPRARAWLATQDIDLPVVLMMAETADGVRASAAAGASFEEALERASDELDALTRAGTSTRSSSSIRAGGPEHHQSAFAGDGLRFFDELDRRAAPISARVLAERWPSRSIDLASKLAERKLTGYIVDRSLPELFGGWHVVRCLIPQSVELSWSLPFRRLASRRIQEALRAGESLSSLLHPIA
jgi:ribosomal protein S12 methylthiotransferase accessory factor YcaO